MQVVHACVRSVGLLDLNPVRTLEAPCSGLNLIDATLLSHGLAGGSHAILHWVTGVERTQGCPGRTNAVARELVYGNRGGGRTIGDPRGE